MTKVYKLYGASTTTANAVAQITIQAPGIIIAMAGILAANDGASLSFRGVEASFNGISQITSNDVIGSLDMIVGYGAFTAAGTMNSGIAKVVQGLRIPVNTGDRIYLHIQSANSVNVIGNYHIYVEQR